MSSQVTDQADALVEVVGAVWAGEIDGGWEDVIHGSGGGSVGKNGRSGGCSWGIGVVGIAVNSAVMDAYVTEKVHAMSECSRKMRAVEAAISAMCWCSRHWFTCLCKMDS
ncbi:unnamed protein product [Schistocephalus solidus]|uniref:Uncharacterized protein n=1 Tax=Schistocephalus solidus TaxID=70667 RepID=A0A183T631_SCHSO|nr:unnamed protein product [Schistocephalus solidus]